MNTSVMIGVKIEGKAISKDNQKRAPSRYGHYFTRKKYRDYANSVRRQARKQYKGKPLEGDLFVTMIFFFKNRVHCDLWNLPKSIGDALNGILWKDDRQVKKTYLEIEYDPDPQVIITVRTIKKER